MPLIDSLITKLSKPWIDSWGPADWGCDSWGSFRIILLLLRFDRYLNKANIIFCSRFEMTLSNIIIRFDRHLNEVDIRLTDPSRNWTTECYKILFGIILLLKYLDRHFKEFDIIFDSCDMGDEKMSTDVRKHKRTHTHTSCPNLC